MVEHNGRTLTVEHSGRTQSLLFVLEATTFNEMARKEKETVRDRGSKHAYSVTP